MKRLTNIMMKLTVLACLLAGQGISQAENAASGWQTLFDGKSVEAFRGFRQKTFPTNFWRVDADGTLHSLTNGKARVDLVTTGQYGSFELELEWRAAPGANSGIMIRVSEDLKVPWHTGLEMQILDDASAKGGDSPKNSAGSLYDLIAPTNKTLKAAGEWNQSRIVAKGNHVEHWLNGARVVAYELGSPGLNALIAQSKYKGLPRFGKEPQGHILIQHHASEVWFRHLRVRRLP